MIQRSSFLVVALLLATSPVPSAQMVVTSGAQGGLDARIQGTVNIGPQAGATNPMPVGTGIIVGRIVDAGTQSPVPGALVSLLLAGAGPLRVVADAEGQFAFRDLPKGRFSITSSKAGLLDGALGRMRPGGFVQTLELVDGQRAVDISISMWCFAAIGGVLTDERNEPVVGASVRVLRRTTTGGQRRLSMGPTDATDDRGMYRIGGLEPGDYLVVVPMTKNALPGMLELPAAAAGQRFEMAVTMPAGGGGGGGGGGALPVLLNGAPLMNLSGDTGPATAPGTAYPTQFYPSAPAAARATAITLGSGEQRAGIDFELRPVPAMDVSGIVGGPEGPVGEMQLSLIPAEAEDLVSPIETATTFSGADGSFTFSGVPQGQYVLRANRSPGTFRLSSDSAGGAQTVSFRMVQSTTAGGAPPLPTEQTLWAEVPVAVGNTHVTDITVGLRPGIKVSGRVEFDGAATKPDAQAMSSLALVLEPADARTAAATGNLRGRVDANGSFTTMGAPAGRYFLRVPASLPNWTFRSALHAGRDISDVPLEISGGEIADVLISFGDQPIDLRGTVTDAAGASDAKATVILFPTDPQAWQGYGTSSRRLRSTRVGADGTYVIPQNPSLPPGTYYIAAIPEASAADWQIPEFLQALSAQALRITLGEGDKKTQALRVLPAPGR